MKKNFLLVFLGFYLVFASITGVLAKEQVSKYYIKILTPPDIVKFLDMYVYRHNCSYDFISEDKTVYYIKKNTLFPESRDYSLFKIKFNSVLGGTKITFKANRRFLVDPVGYKTEQGFINYLYKNFPGYIAYLGSNNIQNNHYNLNEIKQNVLKTLPNKIDTSKYSLKDDEYKENQDLIGQNIHQKDDKKLIFTVIKGESIKNYTVEKNNKSLTYDKDGNLKKIAISNSNYPIITYKYNAISGDLIGFSISPEPKISYDCSLTGDVLDWHKYMKTLVASIKKKWLPPLRKDENLKAVAIFKISRTGDLLNCVINQSSGDKDYDDDVIKAINTVAPFDPLPAAYDGDDIDINFTFYYNAKKR